MFRKKTIFLFAFLCVTGVLIVVHFLSAENPTSLTITVYKSELYPDKNGSPEVIFEDEDGIEADIINNPEYLFGEGAVASGVYKRIGLTVKNQIVYSGPNPCGGGDITQQSVRLDATKGEDELVELYFATADDGGDTSWLSNGSFEHPFLLQSPIEVGEEEATVVKIIFNTANTLQCIGESPRLIPPTINVLNYIEEPVSTACFFPADYWFVHFNVSGPNPEDLMDVEGLPSLAEIFEKTEVISGWGVVHMDAPDETGVGVWTVDLTKKAEEGGMAEHRHNISRYCQTECEEGYLNPLMPSGDGDEIIGGTYLISGREVLFTEPGSEGAIEGAISEDCSLLIMVNIASSKDSDLILAIRKTDGFTQLPQGSFSMINSMFEIDYDPSNNFITSNLWSSTTVSAMDIATDEFVVFEWGRSIDFSPQYGSMPGQITAWSINSIDERVDLSISSVNTFTITDDGVLSGPDIESFIVFGANNYGLFAGAATDVDHNGHHSLEVGAIIEVETDPSLSDLNGRWKLAIIDSEADSGGEVGFRITYGDIVVSDGVMLNCSFISKDFTGEVEYEVGSGETIELKEECYEPDTPILNSCDGLTRKVFYVYGTGESTGQVVAKIVLDKTKNVVLLWSPVDKDDIPTENGEGNEYGMVGVGVKVE